MTHSQSQKTISFSSSSCGQLWMSWGFPHMELKKHHHHYIIYFSHLGIQNGHLVPYSVKCHEMDWGILISWKLSILSWVRRGILAADCGFFVCDVCLDLMASSTLLTANQKASLLYSDQWEGWLADCCMGRDEMCLVFWVSGWTSRENPHQGWDFGLRRKTNAGQIWANEFGTTDRSVFFYCCHQTKEQTVLEMTISR